MNKLVKKLASTVLVSAMVFTQSGNAFATIQNVNVPAATEGVASETVETEAVVEEALASLATTTEDVNDIAEVAKDAATEEVEANTQEAAAVEMEEDTIVPAVPSVEATQEIIPEAEAANEVEEKLVTEEEQTEAPSDVAPTENKASDYKPYYPTKITIMSEEKETSAIVLSEDNDSQELSLMFYGEDTPEAQEKIKNPTSIKWMSSNSKVVCVDDSGTAETSISIGEDDDGNYRYGSANVYAIVRYESPFEKKEIKSKAVKVTVIRTGFITKVALMDEDKVVKKIQLINNGNSGDNSKELAVSVVSPASYIDFDDEEWISNSPYVDADGGTISITDEFVEKFGHLPKKKISAKVSFVGMYVNDDDKVIKRVISTVSVTVQNADSAPVLEKKTFLINKFSIDDSGDTADTFRILPKYDAAIDESNIAVYDSKNNQLEDFTIKSNDETDDPYDYKLVLNDEFRDNYKKTKNISAKLLIPYGDGKTVVYKIKLTVLVAQPKVKFKQKKATNLFFIDKIKCDYSVDATDGEIESIKVVFVDQYNRVRYDSEASEENQVLEPDYRNPTYRAEYPAVREFEDASETFLDYSSLYIYPYEHFFEEYTELGDEAGKDDKYNEYGYSKIRDEIDNYLNTKSVRLLIQFKGKFNETDDEPILPADTSNEEWKYKYKLLHLNVKTALTLPKLKTYDYECTSDMIERHVIPDGENIRYEYILNSNAIAYEKATVYEPEYATYVTSDPTLRYPEGQTVLNCVKDNVTKVTQTQLIWNLGSSSVVEDKQIDLRLYNRHWSTPIDVKHKLKMSSAKLPKTKFSATTVTIRNDGSDIASIDIAGPNGVNLDGFSNPKGDKKDYTDDDIRDNDKPVIFFNPYNADEIEKTKIVDDDGNTMFNSKVYITARTTDPKTGNPRTLKPGTYKYEFGGFVINDQGDDDPENNQIIWSEANSITVKVIDAKTSNIGLTLAKEGAINTVCRYDDAEYNMRKASLLKFKPTFTNTARSYMNDPADAIIKKIRVYGNSVSGNYVNETIDYEAPVPDEETGIISRDAFEAYYDNIVSANGLPYPLYSYYDKKLKRIVVGAVPGADIDTNYTYEVTFGICSRDSYRKVTNEYPEDDKNEEGYAYSPEYVDEGEGGHPYAKSDSMYTEYTVKIKATESIPQLKLNKKGVTLYKSSPLVTQKVELSDPLNIVHKYIENVEIDSITGPSLPKTLSKEISREYFDIVFDKATMFYVANPDVQKDPGSAAFKNVITIMPKEDKVSELLEGKYTIKLNVLCEDRALNTTPKQVTVTVDLK